MHLRAQKRLSKARSTRKTKNVPLSRLKRDLDQIFSKYIRVKCGNICYTCGGTGTMQAGHFVSRSYLATRWDEMNVKSQCVGCNIWGRGKQLDFEEHLIKDYGAEAVQALKEKRKQLIKPTRKFYTEQISTFSEKLAKLNEAP